MSARTIARRTAWALAIAWSAYAVPVNVLLNTRWGEQLVNRQPEKFQMHWDRGLSLWPGRVTLWNTRVSGHARNVAWHAYARRTAGRIGLVPLLSRELHVPWIAADEVEADFAHAQYLPPPEPRPGGWTLRFGDIASTTLRIVRYGDVVLAGTGEAHFAFTKQLRGGPFEILPSRIDMRGVEVRHGDRRWLRQATLAGDFAMAKHARGEAPGLAKFGLVDAHVALHGETPGLALVMDDQRRLHGTVDDAAKGTVSVDVGLRRGKLVHGGRFDVAVPLAADAAGKASAGVASLAATIDDGVNLALKLPPPPEGTGGIDATLRVATDTIPLDGDWAALVERTGGHVGVRWRFDSLAWLGPWLTRTPWLRLDGAGEIDANVQLANGRIAEGTLKIPDVALASIVQGHRISGRARADGRLVPEGGELKPHLDVTVDRFDITGEDDPKAIFGRGTNLTLQLASSGRLAEFRDKLTAHLAFDGAQIPDLRVYNVYLPGRNLRITDGSGKIGGDLRLDAAGRIARGSIGITAQGAAVAFGDVDLRGDIELGGRLVQADLAGKNFDFDGSALKLRNVAITDGDRANVTGWWADIAAVRGKLVWAKPFALDATAKAQLSNVGVLLALFSRHRDYPGWALKLIDAGPTSVSARADLRAGHVVLDDVEAQNRRFDLKARLRHADRGTDGSLYLGWGRIGLGLALRDGKRDFKFIGAQKWYEAQPALLSR